MTPEDMIARLDAPLSVRRRLGYLAVLLGGLGGAGLIGALWATEPALAARTAAAFALLVAVGLGWAAFGAWALTRRAPLYARDRVLAAWIALLAWGLGGAGVTAVAATRQRLPWGLPLVVGLLGAAAVAGVITARRRHAALLRRRHELASPGPGGEES